MSMAKAIQSANRVCPIDHEISMKAAKNRHAFMVQTGIILETATISPSTPEMARHFGTSHTTILKWIDGWRRLPWRERHGWLMLAEGAL
jgi:hypothetical protein